MKKIFQTLIACFLLGLSVKGQQVISSSGGSFKSSSIVMDFTVGEVITETYSNSITSLSQGFHQTSLASVPTSELIITDKPSASVKVFPNPIHNNFSIEVADNASSKKIFEITNLSGRIIQSGKLENQITELTLKSSCQGMYILSIKSNNLVIRTVKLIKQ